MKQGHRVHLLRSPLVTPAWTDLPWTLSIIPERVVRRFALLPERALRDPLSTRVSREAVLDLTDFCCFLGCPRQAMEAVTTPASCAIYAQSTPVFAFANLGPDSASFVDHPGTLAPGQVFWCSDAYLRPSLMLRRDQGALLFDLLDQPKGTK